MIYSNKLELGKNSNSLNDLRFLTEVRNLNHLRLILFPLADYFQWRYKI